ncbi:MAG: hypothetical protein KGZ45_06805 [Clostridium sp.]|nr:hypothetical protein [Clostridium sp.]
MDSGLRGLATGIGSLPHKDVKPALDVIFSHLPEIPHWPQLPAAGEEEGFIRQYLRPLLERQLVVETPSRSPYFATDAADWLDRLTAFYSEVLTEINPDASADFGLSESAAAGFYSFLSHHLRQPSTRYLKGQLVGPVTMGFQVTDDKLQPAFYLDELRDVLVRTLALQLRWQARTLKTHGLPVLLFIDDPGICGYGQSAFVGLSREAIQESLQPLIEAAHDEGVSVGVHACAGLDWSLLFELPFDIVNIDVYHYFTSLLLYASEFNRFLSRGGALAWGLVPTSEQIEQETAETLLDRLAGYFSLLEKKGVDSELMRKQLLFTPSCGTGTLSEQQAEKVYDLLEQISKKYRG